MKVNFTKGIGSLVPADDEAEKVLSKIKQGALVRCDISQPRNPRHHRLFFALVNLVFKNQERYHTQEHLLAALKVGAGHCDYITAKLRGGTTMEVATPRSISFAKMSQTEFDQFYDRICDVVLRDFWPDLEKEALKAEVAEMVGAEMVGIGGLENIA